ncbi:MAG: competence protein ComK [Bacilli bacterium]|nr:competence protein ComK [Bacilli bacterium]MBQ6282497.1 competence protein ComK [Bacilli bacterium]
MSDYEINNDTLAVIPIDECRTKIIEKGKSFIVNQSAMKIIDMSCQYFGSSYQGRFLGTKNLIGISYKAPIIIEESNEIIFFPTTSPRLFNCAWISLKNLQNYRKNDDSTIIVFNNGHLLNLDISYATLDSQVLRAARLESVLRLRKSNN